VVTFRGVASVMKLPPPSLTNRRPRV